MKKRILSLLTTLVMIVGIVGVMPSVSAGALTSGDFEYDVFNDGIVGITHYMGDETEVTVPSEIEGMVVTGIGIGAFQNNSKIKSVIISEGIRYIGDSAFGNCTNLTSITIPNSLESILPSAFFGCGSLEHIDIPNSVESISMYAFAGSGLISVTIPDSVSFIGTSAFACTNLTEINVASGNKTYSSYDGILYDKERLYLNRCPGAKTEVTIPDGVLSIMQYAFENCNNLTSVSIPDSVTGIGNDVFYCDNLKRIIIPKSVTDIGLRAFGYSHSGKIEDFIIYCYSGTAGEQYAIDNGFNYILLDGDYPLGDLSGDGKITTVDVGIINSFAKGTKEYTDEQFKLADANADGKITTVDVGLINKIAKSA